MKNFKSCLVMLSLSMLAEDGDVSFLVKTTKPLDFLRGNQGVFCAGICYYNLFDVYDRKYIREFTEFCHRTGYTQYLF